MLGAGGAARAVIAGLLDRGIGTVLVANRTLARARGAASPRPGSRPGAALVRDRRGARRASGFSSTPPRSAWRASRPSTSTSRGLPPTAAVADIVYVPLETPLLAAARERGLRAVDGLGMLLHQAVPGFARWFGVIPQVTPELRALVAADIEAG